MSNRYTRSCRSSIGFLDCSARLRSLLFIILFGCFLSGANAAPADLRILIDVSGSMKQNDPRNLRRPALDLLLQSIPDGSRAGVWTFGKQVNMLVPHTEVDQAWRDKVVGKSRFINSVALRTNIGGALEAASYDLDSEKYPDAAEFERGVILLTDGVVDIDPNAGINESERERILDEVLASYKQAGIKIHTIALSSLADADLLEQLAEETSGSFTVADEADDLSRQFIAALDLTAPTEQVPLEGDSFQIDASVEEFSAVIFRNDQASPTELVAPDGKRYTTSDVVDGVRWVESENYDLITVSSPQTGAWQIGAEADPNNRVTVVSNLSVNVSAIEQQLFHEDQTPLSVTLSQDEQMVIDNRFLELVDVYATIEGIDDNNFALPAYSEQLLRDLSKKGQYTALLSHPQTPGRYRLSITVDGKTFKREKRYEFSVSPSFSIDVVELGETGFDVVATTSNPAWQRGDVSLKAVINDSYGDELTQFQLTRNTANEWYAREDSPGQGAMTLSVTAFRGNQKLPITPVVFQGGGTVPLQRSLIAEPSPENSLKAVQDQEFSTLNFEPVEEEIESAESSAQEVNQAASEAASDEPMEPIAEQTTEQSTTEVVEESKEGGLFSNWMVIAALIAGNLLLIAGLYIVYRKLTAAPDSTLDEELEFADETQETDEPEAKAEPVVEPEPVAEQESVVEEEATAEADVVIPEDIVTKEAVAKQAVVEEEIVEEAIIEETIAEESEAEEEATVELPDDSTLYEMSPDETAEDDSADDSALFEMSPDETVEDDPALFEMSPDESAEDPSLYAMSPDESATEGDAEVDIELPEFNSEPKAAAESEMPTEDPVTDDFDGLLDELNENLEAELDALAKESAADSSADDSGSSAAGDDVTLGFDAEFDLSSDMSDAMEEAVKEEGRQGGSK